MEWGKIELRGKNKGLAHNGIIGPQHQSKRMAGGRTGEKRLSVSRGGQVLGERSRRSRTTD